MFDTISTNGGLPIVFEEEDARRLGEDGELSHWHDAVEVVRVTQGRLRCQTNEHTFELAKGDLCFINRRQLHRLIADGDAEGQGRTLVIDASLLSPAPQIREAYVRPVLEDQAFSHVLLPGHQTGTARIRELVDDIELLMRERPRAWELEVAARCHQLFRELYCALAERGGAAGPVDTNAATVRLMIAHIREHFSEDVQLEDIARAGAVSKSTCSRLFKRYTGRSPINYLIDYRLETSAAQLRATNESIASIAAACGFSQQSYFTKMFRRAYGMSPRAWRAAQA